MTVLGSTGSPGRNSTRERDDGFRSQAPLRGVIGRALLSGTAATGIVLGATNACEPTVIVGRRFCPDDPAEGGARPDPTTPVPVQWSTGFESGFCDYAPPLGFCFATGTGTFSIVTSPVHSGQFAAAFSVVGNGDGGTGQARCVRQGLFPNAAYYGAWYNVPELATNSDNWNLLHFQGGDAGRRMPPYLWDVSLVNLGDGGSLRSTLLDFLPHPTPDAGPVRPIPIGQWFHLEVYFKRANDTSGVITVWQDQDLVADLRGLATDDTDWGQWYVGNLATALFPSASTVYVDDVTMTSGP